MAFAVSMKKENCHRHAMDFATSVLAYPMSWALDELTVVF